MYKVVRKIETNEPLVIATVDDLNKAKQVLRDFKEHWPAEYSIQDSALNQEIDLDLRG
jgi:hypothetical protein